jgi:hypothetical protein
MKSGNVSVLQAAAMLFALFYASSAFAEEAAQEPVDAPKATLAEDLGGTPPAEDPEDEDPVDEREPDPEGECPYFRVEVQRHGKAQAVHSDPTKTFGDFGNLQCLRSMITKLHSDAQKGAKNYFDDRIVFAFNSKFLGGSNAAVKTYQNGFTCQATEHIHGNKMGKGGEWCIQGFGFFDKNCNPADPALVASTCGDDVELGFQVNFIRSSPISLIWESGYDLDSEATVVKFPLDLASAKLFSLWKASAQSPLLVLDRERSGKITSSTQLLGNWTQGGKQLAMAAGTAPAAGPWRDGYEALEQFDSNGDGEVRGEELREFSLWFDKNRDGISQPGEVVTMESVGVTALFFNVDSKDPATGSIRAAKGFERTINGQRIIGASVDWYGETADSEYELVSAALLQSGGAIPKALPAIDPQDPAAAKSESSVSGVWQWQLSTSDSLLKSPGGDGYFILRESEEGIAGYSLTELPFEPNAKLNLRSMVHTILLQGTVSHDAKGQKTLNFEIRQKAGVLRSSARLTEFGALEGTTTASYDEQGKARKLSYSWLATKVVPQ